MSMLFPVKYGATIASDVGRILSPAIVVTQPEPWEALARPLRRHAGGARHGRQPGAHASGEAGQGAAERRVLRHRHRRRHRHGHGEMAALAQEAEAVPDPEPAVGQCLLHAHDGASAKATACATTATPFPRWCSWTTTHEGSAGLSAARRHRRRAVLPHRPLGLGVCHQARPHAGLGRLRGQRIPALHQGAARAGAGPLQGRERGHQAPDGAAPCHRQILRRLRPFALRGRFGAFLRLHLRARDRAHADAWRTRRPRRAHHVDPAGQHAGAGARDRARGRRPPPAGRARLQDGGESSARCWRCRNS